MPFHVYSMRQAIEEHYILDVLANYTTIKEAFKLIRVSEDNPELIEGKTSRALFKYYKSTATPLRKNRYDYGKLCGKLPVSNQRERQGYGCG